MNVLSRGSHKIEEYCIWSLAVGLGGKPRAGHVGSDSSKYHSKVICHKRSQLWVMVKIQDLMSSGG